MKKTVRGTKTTKAFRAMWGGIGLYVLAMPGWGQSASDLPIACTRVPEEGARLRCYDEHMARLGHAVGERPADEGLRSEPVATTSAAATAASTAPEPLPTSSAGPTAESAATASTVETPASPAAPAPDRLVSRVKAITQPRPRELRIELENGQVWVESQRSGGTAPAVGETVIIRRAALGSYLLSREGGGLALRVRRIR